MYCLQVDWEEYYAHYVKTILRLDAGTIQELKTSPHTVSRQIKVLTQDREGGGLDWTEADSFKGRTSAMFILPRDE
jgi:hypothetical protein